MTEEITPAAGSPESLVLSLIALITNPKAAKDHVLAIVAERAAADKRLAAADKREAEVAAQATELGKRQTAADARDAALDAREAIIDEKYSEFDGHRDEAQRDIDAQKRHLVSQKMAFLGLTKHPLQSEPTNESLDPLLYGGKNDAHFSDEIEMPQFEPVPSLVAGSTLTRSRHSTAAERRAMRRVDS